MTSQAHKEADNQNRHAGRRANWGGGGGRNETVEQAKRQPGEEKRQGQDKLA